MIDHQEMFITTKVDAYFRACMRNGNAWVHFSKRKCTSKHRGEIFKRVIQMLRLMDIPFDVYTGTSEKLYVYEQVYKIRVRRDPPTDGRKAP